LAETTTQSQYPATRLGINKKKEEPFYEAKKLYELFFSSIPLIMKQQQSDHWKLILSNFKNMNNTKIRNPLEAIQL